MTLSKATSTKKHTLACSRTPAQLSPWPACQQMQLDRSREGPALGNTTKNDCMALHGIAWHFFSMKKLHFMHTQRKLPVHTVTQLSAGFAKVQLTESTQKSAQGGPAVWCAAQSPAPPRPPAAPCRLPHCMRGSPGPWPARMLFGLVLFATITSASFQHHLSRPHLHALRIMLAYEEYPHASHSRTIRSPNGKGACCAKAPGAAELCNPEHRKY